MSSGSSESSSDDELRPLHNADAVALRKLRDDDASGALKEYFGDGEDPSEWNCVTVADGRVTTLNVYKCSKLAALPAAIGELGALTTLYFNDCTSLAKLPATIGELKALTKLVLYECSSLVALPESIGGLDSLTELDSRSCTSLVELPAAIGELKALTTLYLNGCSSLVELPAAIGELGALTTLDLRGCSSLVELPAAIGELGALTTLYLNGCSSLERLLEAIVGREGLKLVLPLHLTLPASLREDFAALRKLRDDDASGVLKEYFGDNEDPREWEGVTVADGRVTENKAPT